MPYRPKKAKNEPKLGETGNDLSRATQFLGATPPESGHSLHLVPPPQPEIRPEMIPPSPSVRSDAGAVMENKDCPLLDWLLRKYPETPKSRAKQWILAGRVSVGGKSSANRIIFCLTRVGALVLRDRHATTLACGAGGRFIRGFPCSIWTGRWPLSTRGRG